MSFDADFDQRLKELIEYRQKNGDCLVPISPGPNWELGMWVDTMRLQKRYYDIGYEASCLNAAQIEALEKLGFDWDTYGRYDTRVVSPEVIKQSPEVIRQPEGIAKSCPRALQKIFEDDFGEQDHRYSSSHRVLLATRTWKQTPDEIKQTMPRVEGDNVEQKLREWKVEHFGECTRIPVSVPASSEDHPVPDCLVPLLQADVARHPKGSEMTNKMIYAALRRKWKQVSQEAKDLLPHENDPDYFSKLQDWKLQNIPDAADALDAECPPQKPIPVLCPQSLVPLLRDDFARHPRRSRLQDWHLDLALKRRWEEVSQEAKDLLPHEDDPDYFSKLQGWKLQHIPDAADALDVESPPQIQIPLLCPQSLVPLLLDDFARHPIGSKLKDRRLDSALKRRWEEVSQAAKDLLPHEDDPDYVSKLQDWKLQHIPDAAEARDALDEESPPKCSEVVMPESECWPPALQKIFECDFAAQDPRYSESHRRTLTNRIWRQTPYEIKQTIPIVEGDDAEQELQEWKETHFGERTRIPLGVHGCPCVLVPLLQEDFVRHPIGSRLQNRELGQAMKRRWKQVSQAARDMLPDESDPDYFSKLKNWKLQHIPDAVDERNFKTPNGSHFKTPKGSLSKLKVVESVHVAAPKSAPTSVTHDGESARLPVVATAHSILNADSTRNESAAAMEFSDDDSVEQNTASNKQTDDGDEDFQPASDWDLCYMELKSYMRSLYPNGGFVECSECESEKLGDWVAWQRFQYKIKQLSPERIARLEELGFLWKEKDETEEAPANAMAGKSPMQEHLSDDESNDANSSNPNSQDEDGPDGELSQSKSHSDDAENDSDAESNEENGDSETTTDFDRHFEKLKRHMEAHHPNGGYVEQSKVQSLGTRRWMMQVRWMYRDIKAGNKTKLTEAQIRKLESIGFWWEWDQPIAKKKGKTAKSSKHNSIAKPLNTGHARTMQTGEQQSRSARQAKGAKNGAIPDAQIRQLESLAFLGEKDQPIAKKKGYTGKSSIKEHPSDDESNDGHSSNQNSQDEDGPDHKSDNHSDSDGELSQSKNHSDDTEIDSDAKSNEENGDSETPTAFDRHFETLKPYMESNYPNGGYVEQNKVHPLATRRWMLQVRWMYRDRKAGNKTKLTEAQISKLESIGFWWEKDQPIATKKDKTAKSSNSKPLNTGHARTMQTGKQQSRRARQARGVKKAAIPWEANYGKLARFMKKHYPHGGYVRLSTGDKKFSGWVRNQRCQYRKRCMSGRSQLSDDQFAKLKKLGFCWQNPDKNEKSTEPEEENESSESEVEQDPSSEQDDESENEDSESANSSESSDEEEDRPGRQSHSMPVARRKAHGIRTSNVEAYTSKTKKELLRLLKTQLDRVERLENDKVELQSELQECESKLSKSEDDNHSLRIKVKDLKHEQEKLGDENISLTVCNNNLRRSHIKAMMEERAHIERETKRRKLAEDQLEKAKKLIPMELDSAIFR